MSRQSDIVLKQSIVAYRIFPIFCVTTPFLSKGGDYCSSAIVQCRVVAMLNNRRASPALQLVQNSGTGFGFAHLPVPELISVPAHFSLTHVYFTLRLFLSKAC